MNNETLDYYCTGCKKLVHANEVALLETYYEGEFDDTHLACGSSAKLQLLSVPKQVQALQA